MLLLTTPALMAAGEANPNIILNPSAERVAGGQPTDWGFYAGCGQGKWGVAEDAVDGKYSVSLKATGFLMLPKKNVEMVSLAVLAGRSNGYKGPNAYPGRPLTAYAISYWFKTDCPSHVRSHVVSWKTEAAASKDRQYLQIKGKVVETRGDWKKYQGTFKTTDVTCRFVPSFSLAGKKSADFTGGALYVDDVQVRVMTGTGAN